MAWACQAAVATASSLSASHGSPMRSPTAPRQLHHALPTALHALPKCCPRSPRAPPSAAHTPPQLPHSLSTCSPRALRNLGRWSRVAPGTHSGVSTPSCTFPSLFPLPPSPPGNASRGNYSNPCLRAMAGVSFLTGLAASSVNASLAIYLSKMKTPAVASVFHSLLFHVFVTL